jgi:DNA-binding MarR family transcriptional regulator
MAQRSITAAEIGTACVCLGVRKAARRLARRYDEALRPLGITSGQFSILAALLLRDPVPLGVLAETLGMDRTTLNRNLMPLEKRKLIATAALPDDGRVRGLVLAERGRALLDRAVPLWKEAQAESQRRLQRSSWTEFRSLLSALE